MNFLQIEFFQTLARTLNFTKAAKILHTTQPNLSKVIANIEEELGVSLFERSKRDVQLTPAGKVFVDEAEKLMLSYNGAIAKARAAEEGIIGTVKVGFIGSAMISLMPNIVKQFNKEYPSVFLDLNDSTYSRLTENLISKKIDIAFLPGLEIEKHSGISSSPVYTDNMCVIMSKEHPMADCKEVDIRDFIDDNFIMLEPRIDIKDNNLMSAICLEHDFIPKVMYEANSFYNLMIMVECNYGVSIVANHMRHFASDNIKFATIKGYEDYFRMVAAWHNGSHPVIPRFIEVINEMHISGYNHW